MLDLDTAGRNKRDRPLLPPTPVSTIARRAKQIRRRRRAITITAPCVVVLLIAVAVAVGHRGGPSQQVTTGAAPAGSAPIQPQPDPATRAGLSAAARSYAQAWLAGDSEHVQDRWSSKCSPPLPSPTGIAAAARSIRSTLNGNPANNRAPSSVAVRAFTGTTAEAEVRFGPQPQVPGTDNWLHYTYEGRRWKTTDCNQLPIGGISVPPAITRTPAFTSTTSKTTTSIAEPSCASQTLKPAPAYIGRTTTQADQLAAQRGDQIRVTKRDGIPLVNSLDRVSNRVDVVVSHNTITSACHE